MSGYGTTTRSTTGRAYGLAVDPSRVERKVGGITIDWSTVRPIGTNEIQSVTITGTPSGGNFVLSFGGQNTGTIAHNATAADVEVALEALSTIGNGNVRVSGTNPNLVVEFIEDLRGTNVALLVLQTNSLSGGSSPSVAIATTQVGVPEADLTLADGTIVKGGDKYIEAGTVMVKITASGKYGPYSATASDGRQTVDATRRGEVWLLDQTIVMSKLGSEMTGDVFEGGQIYAARLKAGGAGQPSVANVNLALPQISYA